MILFVAFVLLTGAGHVSKTIGWDGDAQPVSASAPHFLPGAKGTFAELCGAGEDLKRMVALTQPVVAAALAQARLPDGMPLSAAQAASISSEASIQPSSANLARNLEGDRDAWKEVTPFADTNPVQRQTQPAADPGQPSQPDRKLKMSSIPDQGDDGDFTVEGGDTKAQWLQNYLICGQWGDGRPKKKSPP